MPLEGEYAPSTADWARTQAELFEATDGAKGADLRGMPGDRGSFGSLR